MTRPRLSAASLILLLVAFAHGSGPYDVELISGKVKVGDQTLKDAGAAVTNLPGNTALTFFDMPCTYVLRTGGVTLTNESRTSSQLDLDGCWARDEKAHAANALREGQETANFLLAALAAVCFALSLAAFLLIHRLRRHTVWKAAFPWLGLYVASLILSYAAGLMLFKYPVAPIVAGGGLILLNILINAGAWKILPARDLTPEEEEMLGDAKIAGAFLTKGAPLTDAEREVIQKSSLPEAVKKKALAVDDRRRIGG